ncbi:hypothetical protein PybrP1_013063 [[Pythium] brassicae (nom. inval.)]|nr:hypothetical protein PybrP1_013063 [[Pythium] brassicae (nom. inval.)]
MMTATTYGRFTRKVKSCDDYLAHPNLLAPTQTRTCSCQTETYTSDRKCRHQRSRPSAPASRPSMTSSACMKSSISPTAPTRTGRTRASSSRASASRSTSSLSRSALAPTPFSSLRSMDASLAASRSNVRSGLRDTIPLHPATADRIPTSMAVSMRCVFTLSYVNPLMLCTYTVCRDHPAFELPDDAALFGLLAVHSDYQSMGVGKTLFAASIDFAKTVGKCRKGMMFVINKRVELQAWYERLGFAWNGDKRDFVYPDKALQDDIWFKVLEMDIKDDEH